MQKLINKSALELAQILSQQQDFVWLDSGVGGRYSILAANPTQTVVIKNSADIKTWQTFLQERSLTRPQLTADLPFCGGWIGYLTYEAYSLFDQIPLIPHDLPSPLAWFGRYETFVLIDHIHNTSKVIASDDNAGHALFTLLTKNTLLSPKLFEAGPPQALTTRQKYETDFKIIKEAIADGTFYEMNYTQEFSGSFSGNPFALYQSLRQNAPAPWMAYLAVGDQSILSASPECFFQVNNGNIHLFPIKGTARRSSDTLEDTRLKAELAASAKEQAELLMVTDLLRNDLGRVCSTGTVQVRELRRVESFSHYHHLVSEITGQLKSDSTAFELLSALFPGGSVTGAPKIKAMEFINRLEKRARGIYTGAIGYFSDDGQAAFNIPIRTITIPHSKNRYTFATGGGIVADSTCAAEFEECLLKAKGLIAALQVNART